MQFSLLRRVFVDAFALTPAKLDWIIDKAREFRPRFIYGYVSSVAAIARHLLERQVKLAGVAAVMTTAERLLPEHRALLAEAFGCPLFDQYGCREVRSIASQCAHGSMHMETDLNVVEFIPDPGLLPQAPQRVVVTPLESYGLPLLRYVNDDLGIAAGPCDCLLPFPTMKLEFGRLSDNFLLPSGRLVHAQYFVTLVFGTSGIRQFQFRQTAPDHFLFKVVWEHPAAAEKTRPLLRYMIAGAEAYLGEGCKIELQEVEQIPLTASGKYRYVISDITSGRTSVLGTAHDSLAGAGDRPVGK